MLLLVLPTSCETGIADVAVQYGEMGGDNDVEETSEMREFER